MERSAAPPKRSPTGRNLLGGLAQSIWTTLIGIAVVPLYLRYLGVEAYGLIGFFATTQALLQILDLGLAPTVNREVARSAATGDVTRAARLLHTLAIVYWWMAIAIAVILAAAAPVIAQHWLQSRALPVATVERAIALMGLIVACRWPVGLYLGALMGTERLVLASAIGIAMSTLANVGAVLVLAFVSPTIEAFFLWQAGAGLVHAVASRWAAWRAVGRPGRLGFDAGELRRVWRFSAGMSGVALFGLAFTQLDKVLLSRIVGLDDFGRYMLATTVASGLYVLVMPLFNAVYPRFSVLVASGDTAGLAALYRSSTRLLSAGLFPVAFVLVFFGEDVVRLWTGDAALAASVRPIVALLAAGTALHGVMYVPHALQLAYGKTRLALAIDTILMVGLVPLMIALALSYGVIGGALAWFLLHIGYVAIGTWMTHRHLLRGTGRAWLLVDVGLPLTLSLAVFAAGRAAFGTTPSAPLARVACAAMLACAACALSFAASPHLRTAVLEGLGLKRRAPAA
jgi:O-antigen/teichoic acid export membrane protein